MSTLIAFIPEVGDDGPAGCFWTDMVGCAENCDAATLTKTTVSVFIPGTPSRAFQPYSKSCPPSPAPKPPPGSSGSTGGLHGCYVQYTFVNIKTGDTAGAIVPPGGTIPSAYSGRDWAIKSFQQVCYP